MSKTRQEVCDEARWEPDKRGSLLSLTDVTVPGAKKEKKKPSRFVAKQQYVYIILASVLLWDLTYAFSLSCLM